MLTTLQAELLGDLLTGLNPGDGLAAGIIVLLLDRLSISRLPGSSLPTPLLPRVVSSPCTDEVGCDGDGIFTVPGRGTGCFPPASKDTVFVAAPSEALPFKLPALAPGDFEPASAAV